MLILIVNQKIATRIVFEFQLQKEKLSQEGWKISQFSMQ